MFLTDSDSAQFQDQCQQLAKDWGYEIIDRTVIRNEFEPTVETPADIFDILNDDCLLEIFESPTLSAVDLFSIARTCKRFYPLAKRAFRKKTHVTCELFNGMDLWQIDMFFRSFGEFITSIVLRSTDSPILEAMYDNQIELEKLSFQCQVNDNSTVDAICQLESIKHLNLSAFPISDNNLNRIAYELNNLVAIEATCATFQGILGVIKIASRLEKVKLELETVTLCKLFQAFSILEEIDAIARERHLELTIGFRLNQSYYELSTVFSLYNS